MRLFSDSIGRKAVMAVTGLLMVLFVISHLLGNLSIFAGPNGINAYAEKLHAMGPLLWVARVVMLAAVLTHLVISIQITMENSDANPTKYAVDRMLKATFASRTMIYSGLVLGAFIVYHLLHFTFRVTPNLVLQTDGLGRFDVFAMVHDAFRGVLAAAIYVVAMISLFLHLSHGVQSTFQSLGLSNNQVRPRLETFGRGLSAVFLVGYGAIPVLILIGVLASYR
jgi:succinate dehydrogenase / fumarate reductase cytochrome b subunit